MKLANASSSPLYETRSIQMEDAAKVQEVLYKDGAASKIMARKTGPADGEVVGVRLHLPLAKKAAVQTIHTANRSEGYKSNKGLYNGKVRDYQQCVVLREAYFNVSQSGRQKIASGADTKHPMASIDGQWVESKEPCFDGIAVSFNPHRVHLFVDALNRPIRFAEEVTVYAHRAYVRGYVEYYTADNAPAKAGNAPSEVVFPLTETPDEIDAPVSLPLAALQDTQASLFN